MNKYLYIFVKQIIMLNIEINLLILEYK